MRMKPASLSQTRRGSLRLAAVEWRVADKGSCLKAAGQVREWRPWRQAGAKGHDP